MTDQQKLPAPVEVTGPGVYDLPEAEYHARPELSSSGARKLLPPSCPALFKHWRDNPEPHNPVFELGTAAHKLVLGVGPDLVLVDADEWRTNAIKAEVAAIRDAGGVPLKPAAYAAVHEMAAALRAHPFAGALFAPGSGKAEQTVLWRDEQTGVDCRALIDWLPNPSPGRRLIVPEFKTCRSAAPDDIEKAFASYGYVQQADWYLGALRARKVADASTEFVFVFQEKEAPYLVTLAQPDPSAMRLAERLNREARETYADCVRRDHWPAYSEDVELIGLPVWYERLHGAGDAW